MKTNTLLKTVVFLTTSLGLCSAGTTVDIKPGMNIPSTVAANPENTTFVIYPGTYRLESTIAPKEGDTFTGQTACAPPKTSCPAIVSGSRLLTSFERSGSYYYVTGQTQQNAVTISDQHCDSGYSGCIYPEDLFFDGTPLKHVTSLSDVTSGTWYFDYSSNTIYFYDNPSGHTVEASVVPYAFEGNANNITIEQLTIKEFATPVTEGVIGVSGPSQSAATDWVIKNNEIELNHSTGVRINFGWQILGNYIHNNGDLGIGGGMGSNNSTNSGVVIQGNEIANNNYAHFKPGFGAGGVKVEEQKGLVVRGNYVHNNLGDGVHLDTNLIDTLIDGNTISDNTEQGFFEEISYAATVRNNSLLRNGYIYPNGTDWLYGANLISSTSQGVEAYCNNVEVSSSGGNAMTIIAQPRSGYTSANNYFHHNTVIFDGTQGLNGAAESGQSNMFSVNKFNYNTYHLSAMSYAAFPWNSKNNDFSQFKSDGQESQGEADTNYKDTVPSVTITSPTDGSAASGTVTVAGSAPSTDKVEFYVDWTLKTTDYNPSFDFDWSTSGVSAGAHVLAAMAYTSEGVRSCHAITVNVQ